MFIEQFDSLTTFRLKEGGCINKAKPLYFTCIFLVFTASASLMFWNSRESSVIIMALLPCCCLLPWCLSTFQQVPGVLF